MGEGAPSSELTLPPGWGTNPALIARMPPACVEGRGDPRNSRGRRGRTLLEAGSPCPAGREGRIRADLETTRINRFGVS